MDLLLILLGTVLLILGLLLLKLCYYIHTNRVGWTKGQPALWYDSKTKEWKTKDRYYSYIKSPNRY